MHHYSSGDIKLYIPVRTTSTVHKHTQCYMEIPAWYDYYPCRIVYTELWIILWDKRVQWQNCTTLHVKFLAKVTFTKTHSSHKREALYSYYNCIIWYRNAYLHTPSFDRLQYYNSYSTMYTATVPLYTYPDTANVHSIVKKKHLLRLLFMWHLRDSANRCRLLITKLAHLCKAVVAVGSEAPPLRRRGRRPNSSKTWSSLAVESSSKSSLLIWLGSDSANNFHRRVNTLKLNYL